MICRRHFLLEKVFFCWLAAGLVYQGGGGGGGGGGGRWGVCMQKLENLCRYGGMED